MSELRRARWAVAGVFAVHGGVYANFATRVPWLETHLGIGHGELGLALLMPSVGALLSMPFAGRLVHRYGGRSATRWLLMGWCASLVLPALAPDLGWFCLALLVYGAASGTADVAMNAQGVVVEQRLGRSVMSGFHGMWSAGGLLGSGLGALAAAYGVDARLHFAGVAVLLMILGWFTAGRLLPVVVEPGAEAPPHFAVPSRAIAVIALVGFAAIFAEGSSSDWCAVYLQRIAHAAPGVAATAFTAFAFTMAGGRLAGDAVVRRYGAVATVRAAAVVGTAGGLLVVLARVPVVVIVGFAGIGIGVAVVVPLAFAAAGHAGPHPANQIAGVATIAYGAGIAAPGAIGGIAHATSLTVSFMLVTALVAVIGITAGVLRPARPATNRRVRASLELNPAEQNAAD